MNNEILTKIYATKALDCNKVISDYLQYAELLMPRIIDAKSFLQQALASNKQVLFEGAQGSMLDIEFGNYPYVTSSSPSVGGVLIGSGISYRHVSNVVGVMKGYSTRVGEGTFLTELNENEEAGKILREKGQEYGSTTQRPRRCGWLDLCVVKSAVLQNGINALVINKIDILSYLAEIKICVGYDDKGEFITDIPANDEKYSSLVPIYKIFEGWQEDISAITLVTELPQNCLSYIKFIEDFLQVKIIIISIGAKRNQTIIIDNIL